MTKEAVSKLVTNSKELYVLADSAVKKARAIRHPLRLQILKIIDDHEAINVRQLYIKLRISQSEMSQHLAVLRKGGFVRGERSGKEVYYHVNYEVIREFVEAVNKMP